MPAEWWPHDCCWMAWPTRVWHSLLEPARQQVAAVVQAVVEFEGVSIIASPASAEGAAKATGATDKVIRVTGAPDWLLALDFQAGHDSADKPADMNLYNAALFKRHHLLVRSVMVLLHRGAD